MLEYKGYKLFRVDYGEQDYIVAKTAQDALNYFFSNVGDEYDKDGLSIEIVKEDFMVNQSEINKPSELASILMERDITLEENELQPYLLASSVY